MPKSRSRKPRNRSKKERRRQRRNREAEGRRSVAVLRPGQSIEHLLTEQDHVHLEQGMEAAARGDARAALDHYLAGPVVEESLTRYQLRELVLLGDDAPGWMYSRWAVDQAYRWMLLSKDPRTDDIVRLVLAATHFDHVEDIAGDPLALTEYGTFVASTDWLCEQLAVYEAGGLRDFLDVKAQPGLLSRADNIEEWERAAMDAYELVASQDDVLEVRRLSDGVTHEVLNLGAAADVGLGVHVIGRVVPVTVWPFAMFESRPLVVDREIAMSVAERCDGEDDLGWFLALANAREEGRLARGFSCGRPTLFSTDIAPDPDRSPTPREEMPGRMVELVDAGLSEYVANGVLVAEVALIAARVNPETAGVLGPHLTSVLVDPMIVAALKEHSTLGENEVLWRTLASCTPSPARERCLELAEACAGAGRMAS